MSLTLKKKIVSGGLFSKLLSAICHQSHQLLVSVTAIHTPLSTTESALLVVSYVPYSWLRILFHKVHIPVVHWAIFVGGGGVGGSPQSIHTLRHAHRHTYTCTLMCSNMAGVCGRSETALRPKAMDVCCKLLEAYKQGRQNCPPLRPLLKKRRRWN